MIDNLQLDALTKRIPLVVCASAHALARTTKQWLLQQGCTVVEKPFEVVDWLEAIRARTNLSKTV